MIRSLRLRSFLSAGALALVSLLPRTGAAASLEQVSGWEINGLPGDVSMYAYVPDAVVENPPLVVLIHYCGGTAPAVFGQAQGGGLVSAADEYGFVIIAPSSGRCWDVVSDQARTREGGGDSHAIRQMVTHALATYGANPSRVYATGDSSGGMMTELLLGLYPEVFKGGSAMAGMPAGCRGDNESGNGGGYSGACAGGSVDRTPEAWGAVLDSLNPGYEGPRPRVQMFHGDQDEYIHIDNHAEAIEQWSYALGLPLTPDEEVTNVTLGTHSAIRQTWIGECGLPVLDAFTSLGGDHGPSDALFLEEHLVPFLGLDHVGPVDPYVEACDAIAPGTGGSDGAGGTDAAGGNSGAGGGIASGGTGGGLSGAGGSLAGVGGSATGGVGSGGDVGSGTGGAAAAPGSGGGAATEGPAAGTDRASSSSETGGCNVARRPAEPLWLALSLMIFGAAVGRRQRRQVG